MKALSVFCGLVIVALAVGCGGGGGVTGPDGVSVPEGTVISALGYRIKAADYQGEPSQAHADLADRWWQELMADLRSAGYSEERTDPTKHVAWVFIFLHQPVDDQGQFIHERDGATVGGYYDVLKPAFHVSGDYATARWPGRPNAQALKHEMLHHWCQRTLGHVCLEPGVSEWEGHHWTAPNGADVWNFTWH